jgi:hypothetical protein
MWSPWELFSTHVIAACTVSTAKAGSVFARLQSRYPMAAPQSRDVEHGYQEVPYTPTSYEAPTVLVLSAAALCDLIS